MRLLSELYLIVFSLNLNCLDIDRLSFLFFFNDTATTEIYTLSLHDALPIQSPRTCRPWWTCQERVLTCPAQTRSEEHTSELQSRPHLVCRLLLEKKNKTSDPWTFLSKLKSAACAAVTYPHKQPTRYSTSRNS